MIRKLIVDVGPFETRYALLEDGRLAEYESQLPDAPVPEQFYRGKVLRVVPSLDAAFVDIGEALPAFLPHADHRYRQGDRCLVQAEAIPTTETKGIRVTDLPQLTGHYLVLTPQSPGVHVSKKLPEREQAEAKAYALTRCPDGSGLIVRTDWQTLEGDKTPFDHELSRLLSKWEEIRKMAEQSYTPGLLSVSTVPQRCRSMLCQPGAEIHVNSSEFAEALIAEQSLTGTEGARIFDDSADGPLIFDPYQIDEQLEKAGRRRIWLKSGGFLVVDQTEAFTVYDVNSGRDERKGSPDEKALAVNLEAAEMVLQHIRLCNMGGIILVDLIDMDRQARREQLLEFVRSRMKLDPAVHEEGITSLGILQLTRKRTGLPLYRQIRTACSVCQGTGSLPDARQTEGEIRRTVARRLRAGQESGYRIGCSREVQELIRKDPFFENVQFSLHSERNYSLSSQ